MQKDVLYGLQQGTKVLHAIHKEMGGIEAVEKLMGETEEARAYQEVRPNTIADLQGAGIVLILVELVQEISQMLAGQLSNQDEDEVEDELEALQREVEGPIDLPSAPTAELPEEAEATQEQKAKEQARVRAKARATPLAA